MFNLCTAHHFSFFVNNAASPWRFSSARLPLYEIERRNGVGEAKPEAIAFATARVADGARELRDLIVVAWDDSIFESVGYPAIPVRDILSGTAMPRARGIRRGLVSGTSLQCVR